MISIRQFAYEVDRSVTTLNNWRRKGAPGFSLIGGRVYVDPHKVNEWRRENRASVPGPKGAVTTKA